MPDDGARLVASSREEGVCTITLNRPEAMNATTPQMLADYFAALRAADADPAVRAVVVTGAGRGFCAGADQDWLREARAQGDLAAAVEIPGGPPDIALDLGVPVIGAINGSAFGSGFVLMVMTDVRFVAAEAKFCAPFARLGLVAEYGLSWLLPRLIGVADALDLLLSGRVIGAAEAKSLGLAQRVLPREDVLAAAQAYARVLATECSPTAMATIRAQVYGDLDRSRAEAVVDSFGLVADGLGSTDLAEAVQARAEGRLPRFAPRQISEPSGGRP